MTKGIPMKVWDGKRWIIDLNWTPDDDEAAQKDWAEYCEEQSIGQGKQIHDPYDTGARSNVGTPKR